MNLLLNVHEQISMIGGINIHIFYVWNIVLLNSTVSIANIEIRWIRFMMFKRYHIFLSLYLNSHFLVIVAIESIMMYIIFFKINITYSKYQVCDINWMFGIIIIRKSGMKLNGSGTTWQNIYISNKFREKNSNLCDIYYGLYLWEAKI